MRRRDMNKLLIAYAAAQAPISRITRAQSCGEGPYAKTPKEAAAGVPIVDQSRCPGDWRRYGADASGAADSTAAIQAACAANTLAYDPTGGTYLVTAEIKVPSGVTVRGAGAGVTSVTCPNGSMSVFSSSGANGVTIEKMTINVTAVSKEAHTGAVKFQNSTQCACRDCEITGCNWGGVLIQDSTYCTVDQCYFHDFQGAVPDSADVCIYSQSHHNRVTNNRCFGGNWHGVSIEAPYNNSLPSNNLVANNAVGEHQAYGLMIYIPTSGDSFNQLTGNTVENIVGSVLQNNAGAGIYVVGAGAGGATVANNTVRNCCIKSKQRSLAPAGIGINGISAGAAPISVTGNTVSDIGTHDAILIVSSKGPVSVSGNTASLPSGNFAGTPIRLDAASNVSVSGNSASRAPETNGRCIFVYANSIAISNIAVTGNACAGGGYAEIEFLTAGTGSITDVTCADNTCRGASSDANCVRLVGVQRASVAGNKRLGG